MCLDNRDLKMCVEDTIVFKVVLDVEGTLYTLFRGASAGSRFGTFAYDNAKLDHVLMWPSPMWPDHGITAFFDMESASTYCRYVEEEFVAEHNRRNRAKTPVSVKVVALYLPSGTLFQSGTIAFSRSGFVIMELDALEAESLRREKHT